MPDANEVLGCPNKQIFYRFISQKFLKTFFVVSSNFTFISLYFYFILTIHLQKILTTFFSPLFLTFASDLTKNLPSLASPPGRIPGAYPPPPPPPPLHATGEKRYR